MRRVLRARGGLWRHRDFLKLWSAETISQLGTQVSLLALPLVAILNLEASAFEVAALATVQYLPFVVLGLPAGVWVDRLRRRPILIVSDLARAGFLLSIPAAYLLDSLTLWQLYAVGFLAGSFTVFFDFSYTAYLPSLIRREQLVEGNAKLEVSRSGAQIGGPGIGGFLVQALSAPIAVLIDALSFIASAIFLLVIRHREEPPERDPAGRGMRQEIVEGFRFVLRQPYLRSIALATAWANLFWNVALAVYLVYAVRELALQPAVVGLVFTLGNVGFLVGAVTVGALHRRAGVGRTIVASAALFGPAWILVVLAPAGRPVPFLIAGQALGAFAGVVFNITTLSLRQSITPARMQGRTVAVLRLAVWGTIPLGSLLGGALASAMDVRAALWTGAIGASLSFIPVLASPVRRLWQMPAAEDVKLADGAPLQAGA